MNILRTNFHHIHISIMRHFYFWIIVVKKKHQKKIFFFFFFENMECGKEIFYREFSTRSDEKYFEKIFFFFNYFLNFFLYRIYLIDFQNNKFFINDAQTSTFYLFFFYIFSSKELEEFNLTNFRNKFLYNRSIISGRMREEVDKQISGQIDLLEGGKR